ncbi:MAG: SdpI family protein [Ginsengibacter sp.]
MKQRSYLLNLLMVILAISPLAFLAIIFNKLPDIVPVHYNIHFKPDKMDNKNMLWLVNGMLSLVSLIVYFLLLNLHRIDPKRRSHAPSLSFQKIAIVVAVFITVINFLILLSVNNNIKLSAKLLLTVSGLMIALIGNYMNNIKPNYFAGIRLPWTLSSDYNWKKTHQLAGKLWFWSGFFMVVIILVFPSAYSVQIFFTMFCIIIIIPVIYSYWLFKQEKLNQS